MQPAVGDGPQASASYDQQDQVDYDEDDEDEVDFNLGGPSVNAGREQEADDTESSAPVDFYSRFGPKEDG